VRLVNRNIRNTILMGLRNLNRLINHMSEDWHQKFKQPLISESVVSRE